MVSACFEICPLTREAKDCLAVADVYRVRVRVWVRHTVHLLLLYHHHHNRLGVQRLNTILNFNHFANDNPKHNPGYNPTKESIAPWTLTRTLTRTRTRTVTLTLTLPVTLTLALTLTLTQR